MLKWSLRLVLAHPTQLELKFHQVDVKSTFQNEQLEVEVYVEQP